MFSLFGKKKGKTKITDRIFISSGAKQNAIQQKIANDPGLIIITWFDESYNQVKRMASGAEIYLAKEIASHHVQNKNVLFFEHYPLLTKEYELLQKLQLDEAIFYSSLDEPIFMHFGGEKMISLMEKMGVSENEVIEHPMISAAIKNAQEKISKEIIVEHAAQCQAEWFSKNIMK